MIFEIHCGDVLPGCPAHFTSTDRDRLLADVTAHAAKAHGLAAVDPPLLRTIESQVRSFDDGSGG